MNTYAARVRSMLWQMAEIVLRMPKKKLGHSEVIENPFGLCLLSLIRAQRIVQC